MVNPSASASSSITPGVEDYINVYVQYQSTAPFYKFYLSNNTSGEEILTLNPSLKYTFHILGASTAHSFYISDQGYEQVSSSSITLSGDGTPTQGINGNEHFKLEFNDPSNPPESLYYYCTDHSNMIGDFFELDLASHTWVDKYYVITKTSAINKIKGTIPTGKYLYVQNNIDIKSNKSLTVQSGGQIILASLDSSEYTPIANLGTYEDSDGFWVPSISSCVYHFVITNNIAKFLPGGDYEKIGPIELWNTSLIKELNYTFQDRSTFNKDISNWDVSGVTSMQQTFSGATKFNQPIGKWNVSNVTNMKSMFFSAQSFNQSLGDWTLNEETGKTINMEKMFNSATNFNNGGSSSIGKWNVSNVTKMIEMFRGANATKNNFNQNISDWERTSGQPLPSDSSVNATSTSTLSNVKDMYGMFHRNKSFNQNIGSWNVSNVTTMMFMFAHTENFDGNISDWERTLGQPLPSDSGINATSTSTLSNVKDMSSLFNTAQAFNQDISGWDISNVTGMTYMFYHGSPYNRAFDKNLSSWGSKFNANLSSPITEMFYPAKNSSITTPLLTSYPNLVQTPSKDQTTWEGYWN